NIYCKNLYLITGNHDKDWTGSALFKEVRDYKVLKLDTGLKLVMFHYPIMDWQGKGHEKNCRQSIHLHGHVHNIGSHKNLTNFISGVYRYDVGVDANDFKPVSLDEILALQ
ncbi:MAG: hypothetical protein LBP91_00435, partial [Coriobacteriales bacterium]|nr:hypothetical protein [Coriobacteriales bacterium]